MEKSKLVVDGVLLQNAAMRLGEGLQRLQEQGELDGPHDLHTLALLANAHAKVAPLDDMTFQALASSIMRHFCAKRHLRLESLPSIALILNAYAVSPRLARQVHIPIFRAGAAAVRQILEEARPQHQPLSCGPACANAPRTHGRKGDVGIQLGCLPGRLGLVLNALSRANVALAAHARKQDIGQLIRDPLGPRSLIAYAKENSKQDEARARYAMALRPHSTLATHPRTPSPHTLAASVFAPVGASSGEGASSGAGASSDASSASPTAGLGGGAGAQGGGGAHEVAGWTNIRGELFDARLLGVMREQIMRLTEHHRDHWDIQAMGNIIGAFLKLGPVDRPLLEALSGIAQYLIVSKEINLTGLPKETVHTLLRTYKMLGVEDPTLVQCIARQGCSGWTRTGYTRSPRAPGRGVSARATRGPRRRWRRRR
ncbi:hypothetical protein T484DRAFT_3564938 [Baffinella frigidus]|nr:hypothetical protein T484DRAFT_3564938 [Cryptophyta sp. CCMP2293]